MTEIQLTELRLFLSESSVVPMVVFMDLFEKEDDCSIIICFREYFAVIN